MARRPRLSGEEIYHHIYAWGNNRQAIFLVDKDYQQYLFLLEEYSNECRVDIIAYALMQSHVHLFVYDRSGQVSQFINCLHGEYAQYFNRVTGNVGHVFGERFNNKIVQANEYGLWLSRYIHRQAVEAGIVNDPSEYPWTSYRAYLDSESLGFLKIDVILKQFGGGCDRIRNYRNFIMGNENGPVDWDCRSLTVVGDQRFQQEICARKAINIREKFDNAEIISLVAGRFNVTPELLQGAQGLSEKNARREIIRYLVEEVGIKPTKIVQVFNISRSAVHKMLKAKVQKCMPVPRVRGRRGTSGTH